ncbi:MAG: carbohydrate-binding domain-containing protein [Clostridia bacterium]|nr:carbohydrate-binding domain-containing protein [Clostridia bacterium]
MKKLISLLVAAMMTLCLLPPSLHARVQPSLRLETERICSTETVIIAKAGGMRGSVRVSARSSNESLATVRVDGERIAVEAVPGAVGIARITVTAEDEAGGLLTCVRDVPVGYTAFYFSGDSVTVIAGADNKYEVVGRQVTDELDHELTVSTDTSGNTVYTASGDTKLCIEIKKAGGAYVFGGTANDASIAVKKEATGNAFILMNELDLTSSYTSPITIKKNSNAAVVITALAGTVNTLTDSEFNNADIYGPEEDGGDLSNQFYAESAVIKAKTGATVFINGEGTLNINSNAKNGIKSGADSELEISELTLNVNALKNGISSENELNIVSGNISVTTQTGDAIKAEDDTSEIGTINVTGGDITINAADEGIAASANVNIYGGTLDITCGGDAVKAENLTETAGDIYVCGGEFTINTQCDGFQAAGNATFRGGNIEVLACGGSANTAYNKDTMPSAKGIKAGGELTFYDGVYDIDSADDALHSNGNLTILGGEYTLASTDDGIHADFRTTLGEAGGDDSAINVNITTSYEGIEGANIIGYSGVYTMRCTDDCINAANSDLGGYAFTLRLYGGTYHCYGGNGDGVDSNGEFSNIGALVEIFTPSRGNFALDSDGTMTLYGGTTLAVGSSDMVEAPQNGVYVRFGSSGWGGGSSFTFANGDALAVYNSSNQQIYSTVVRYHNTTMTSSTVIFASPDVVSGQSYRLYKNGSQVASANASGNNPGNPPVNPATAINWQSVGEQSEQYARVTSLEVGVGAIITNTANTYALSGGGSIGSTAVTVSSVTGGYAISGAGEANTWYKTADSKLYCTVNGTNYYLAYAQSGGGWNPSYTLTLTTAASSAAAWAFSPSGNYARITTVAAGQGGPGGGGPGGGGRTLYLVSSGSSFALSTSGGNLCIYSPDTAQAALEGVRDYFVNLDNGESVDESTVFANAQIKFRASIGGQTQTLEWSDSRVSYEWAPAYSAGEAGDYSLNVSVLGTYIGSIRVIAVGGSAGSNAPVPPEYVIPNPPTDGVLGDSDGNGSVNMVDAILALRHAMGLEMLGADGIARADIDGNGSISMADAVEIMRLALGIV